MKSFFTLIFVALLVSACGGGSGGSPNLNGGAPGAGGETLSALDKALRDGEVGELDELTLLEAMLEELYALAELQGSLLGELGWQGALQYPVTRQSQFVSAQYGEGATLLRGSKDGRSLAAVSRADGWRGAGFGFNPFSVDSNQQGMVALLDGTLSWLAGESGDQQVALAGFSSVVNLAGWFDQQENWSALPCEANLDNGCLKGSSVLLFSDQLADDATLALLDSAQKKGLGLIYVHTRGWNSSELGAAALSRLGLQLGGYGGNWWAEDTLDWVSIEAMLSAMQAADPLLVALEHFRDNSFLVDWDQCGSDMYGRACDDVTGLRESLLDGLDGLRESLQGLDQSGVEMFAAPGRRLLKLAVLLGDRWRQGIDYPMKRGETPNADFFRALYADYSVYYHRLTQPAQPDLGSFSDPISSPASTTLSFSRTVKGTHFSALGGYLLPGETVTVIRDDHTDALAGVRFNTQRTGSTRLWSEYNRPRFLTGPTVYLQPGERRVLSSPYGGTIQLVYSSEVDATVQLTLENVAEHPFLEYGPDMQQGVFAAALQNSELTWTQVRSPFAEIHSRRDRMNESINESRYQGDSSAFLNDLFEYMLRDAYSLSGFQGDGVGPNARVLDRCAELNWNCTDSEIHQMPRVQHINVDWYAHCGAGCSGNPYDQAWKLDPYGWGESHELGHNLQRGRLNIYGGQSIEVSCNLFPLHKNQRLLRERGEDLSSDRIRYKNVFDVMKSGLAAGQVSQAVYDAVWSNPGYAANNGERMAFYAQLVHLWGEVVGDIHHGWDIYTLLYLAERQFTALGAQDWSSQRDRFAMGTFASKPDLNGNDFMLLMSSWLSQRDLRSLWDIWGVEYSAEIDQQLDALDLPVQAPVIWVAPSTNRWDQGVRVPVQAAMVWPFS